jgi:hypothetical protein
MSADAGEKIAKELIPTGTVPPLDLNTTRKFSAMPLSVSVLERFGF